MTTKSPNVGQTERVVSTVAGGSLIALSIVRPSLTSIVLGGLGAALAYRGISGRCPVYTKLGVTSAGPNFIAFQASVTVRRSPQEVYDFCLDGTGVARASQHFEQVLDNDPAQSRWLVRLPGNRRLSWRAELIADRPGELIEWRALDGGDVRCSGHVRFEAAPGGRGTEVHLMLRYEPASVAGAIFAKLADGALQKVLERELKRAKQLLETGEISTTEGQTSGRAEARQAQKTPVERPDLGGRSASRSTEQEAFGQQSGGRRGDQRTAAASAASGADGFDETAPNYAEYDESAIEEERLGPGAASGSRPGGGRGGRHDGHHAATRRGKEVQS